MSHITVGIQRKVYPNGVCAIQDLHFTLAPGEFVAVVGPSGTGKSTLLRLVSGLDPAFDGMVSTPAHSRLGYMFQEPRLMPWLSVLKNLQMVQPAMTREQVVAQLARVGLADCADRFPNQLSGGMQRRVALLRAFMVSPQLLLMDEPFQSLDAPTAELLRSQLMELWQRDRPSVLFVTHSLHEALALASRVLFLSDRPSHVMLDWEVNLPGPRSMDSPAVQGMADALLRRYPALLRGRLDGAPDSA